MAHHVEGRLVASRRPLHLAFRQWGLGVEVWGLGFGVWGLEFGAWGLGSGVWGLGLGLRFGFRGLGFGGWDQAELVADQPLQRRPLPVYILRVKVCGLWIRRMGNSSDSNCGSRTGCLV